MTESRKGINKKQVQKPRAAHCPYVGLLRDPSTVYGTPDQVNRCFHIKHPAQVALEHQASFCLVPNFLECEVYKGDLTASLPKGIRLNQRGAANNKIFLVSLGLTLSVISLFGISGWMASLNSYFGSPNGELSTNTPTYILKTESIPTSTSTATQVEHTPTFTNTLAPTLTPSRSPIPSATSTSLIYLPLPTNTPFPTNPPSPPKHTRVPPPTDIPAPPASNTPVPPPPNTQVPPPTAAPTDIPPTTVPN